MRKRGRLRLRWAPHFVVFATESLDANNTNAATAAMISQVTAKRSSAALGLLVTRFSLAGRADSPEDMSTHMSTSYFGVRVRLRLNRHGIINVHILAVPVHERHTAEVIFDTAARALDALCPSWSHGGISSS